VPDKPLKTARRYASRSSAVNRYADSTEETGDSPVGLKRYLRMGLNSVLNRYGFEIVASRLLYEWQKYPRKVSSYKQTPLPEEASSYLVQGNPRLRELQERYSSFNSEVMAPFVWTDSYVRPDDMLYFRGDNAYVWQLRGRNMNELGYALATYYVKSIDKLNLLQRLEEDELFGNYSFLVDDTLVSRDLLDSISEIYFLERHLGISSLDDLTVLDIGAGYGRLAHRMLNALPNISQYLCADAFAISSFICEYYLRYRNLEHRAEIAPIYEIEDLLRNRNVDIAVNIHSFSECRLSAIEWWLSILAKYNVKNFMVVPNPPELRTNDGVDFGDMIEKHGYRMIARDPKYRDPVVQQYAINPSNYYLFELHKNDSA
jgi:hypothetical protein